MANEYNLDELFVSLALKIKLTIDTTAYNTTEYFEDNI